MNYSIIITTIYVPKVLDAFARNFELFGHKDEVEIIVIGDLRSPSETSDYVAQFARQGFHFEYWDVEKQRSWLSRFPDIAQEIPYNSDNRRNVGYLIAC